MKKKKLISILIVFIIIWNVIFPCISHANSSISIAAALSQYGPLDTIDKIKYAYEQIIIELGEAKKQELLDQRYR